MTKAYIRLVNNHCDFDVLFIFIRTKGDVIKAIIYSFLRRKHM